MSREARWLLLNEAANLFHSSSYRPGFDDILAGGQVRIVGKRDGCFGAEPIEALLKQARRATFRPYFETRWRLFDISIDSLLSNTITFAIASWARDWLLLRTSETEGVCHVRAELAAVGLTGPLYQESERFHEVRVERKSFIDAAEAAGYPIGGIPADQDRERIASDTRRVSASKRDYKRRVAKHEKAGRIPPIQTTKGGVQGDREWAHENGVSRANITDWRREFVKARSGRPPNSAGK